MQEPPQDPIETPPDPPKRVRGRKRRFAKKWSRRFTLLAIGLLAALVVTFFTIDIGRISLFGASLKSLAESRASKYLERPMHIGRIVAYPARGYFAFEDVEIEGPTKDSRPFFSAKRIFVNVPWWTTFRKDLYLDIGIYDWRMVVEKGPDGVKLPKLTGKKKEGEESKPFPLKIRSLDIYCHNGEFIYDDHQTPWSVKGPNLEFALVRTNSLNTYVGNAKFTKGLVQIQSFLPMSADFSTRFQINNGLVDLKHIDLLTDGANTHLNGWVDFAHWPDSEYHIQSTVDFNRMRELFFANAQNWRLSGTGRFNGIFKLNKDPKLDAFDLSGLFKSDEAGFGWNNSEWRFGNLDGELQWTPKRFIVKRADSDFLGGRMKLVYGLDRRDNAGSAASLSADYNNVDLYLFTRQFGWTALEPQGRMRGHTAMEWENSHFADTMQGQGNTWITGPAGQALATETLPPATTVPPTKRDDQFQKTRPYGEFPIGGETGYRFTWTTLDFDPSWVATHSTFVKFSGHARGGEANLPFHVTSHEWQDSDRMFTAIMSNFNHPTGAIPVWGRGTFDGKFTKAFNAPRIEGHFDGDRMRAWGSVWNTATGDVVIENSYLTLANGRITYGETGTIVTSGKYALGYPRSDGGEEIDTTIKVTGVPLEPLREAFGMREWPVYGEVASADLTLKGSYEKPSGSGTMRIERGSAWDEPFAYATSDLRFEGDGSVRLQRVVIGKGTGRLAGDARISWADDNFFVAVSSDGLPLQEIATFRIERAPLTGQLRFRARGEGSFEVPTWEITDLAVPDLYAGDEGVGDLRVPRLRLANNVLTFDSVAIRSMRLDVDCQGTVALIDQYDAAINCRFDRTSLDPYFKFIGRDVPFNRAVASGIINATGPLLDTKRLTASAHVSDALLTLFAYELTNDESIDLSFRDNILRLDRVRFKGKDTSMALAGQANLTTRTLDVRATGTASLAVLQAFYPSLEAGGSAGLGFSLTGTFDAPELIGNADIADGLISSPGLPGLTEVNGRITMANGRISVDRVTGVMGEGPVLFAGGIILDGYRPISLDLHANGNSLHMRYPTGLRSTVNANLHFTGPVSAPVLSGEVNVIRAIYSLPFQPEKGLFSFIGGGGEEALAGAVDIRPTAPIKLAIKIRAASMPFVDNKAAGALIFGSANVDVTGTIDQPIITGRVEIDHGTLMFSGYRYTIGSGSIDFSNPTRFDPFFDLTAETDAHTTGQVYHVIVRITGTFNAFEPTLTSDPYLSEMQIVSLIMGEKTDAGRAELNRLNSSQDEQAKALSTLGLAFITSPITSTVGGLIQRATTVNTQIVPLLGSESTLQQLNPTARIVLGRPVSSKVYVTYSRTLSGSQNEIILVEIQQNDKISWVLSRNEDKTFAVDFRVRYVVR